MRTVPLTVISEVVILVAVRFVIVPSVDVKVEFVRVPILPTAADKLFVVTLVAEALPKDEVLNDPEDAEMTPTLFRLFPPRSRLPVIESPVRFT